MGPLPRNGLNIRPENGNVGISVLGRSDHSEMPYKIGVLEYSTKFI